MKTRSVLLVCFILAAVFSCSMVGYIFGVTVAREENTPHNLASAKQDTTSVKTEVPVISDLPKNEETEESPEELPKETYVLREENGKIALFTKSADGKENLHSSYDVPIVFLPKSDREALHEGIEFNSLDEIMKFIEDYVG